MNCLRKVSGTSNIGIEHVSFERTTTAKNRFHSDKAAARKFGFGRIGQANSNGLHPVFRGTKAWECGSARKGIFRSSRNNLYNYNRSRQFVVDGAIAYLVGNNSENSKVLTINTFVLDNILIVKTSCPCYTQEALS